MARLTVKIHGQSFAELNLQPGHEYFAGRGSNCAIHLAHERGISRQHLKVYQANNTWNVQLTSKYGGMVYNGQTVDHIELSSNTHFSVPPYDFYFSTEDQIVNSVPMNDEVSSQEPVANEAQEFQVEPHPATTSEPLPTVTPADNTYEANMDATQAGVSQLIAYLRVVNHKTKIEDVFKLEGHLWTAGRHPSCEVVINDSAISRKHFDISHSAEGYFLTDHGSSNGTKLNGDKIEPHKPQKLVSGDVITVRNIEVTFEIHDTQFQNQLLVIDPESQSEIEPATASLIMDLPANMGALESHQDFADAPNVLRLPSPAKVSRFKPIHGVIGVLAVIFVYLFISSGNQKKDPNIVGQGDAPSTEEKLKQVDSLSPEKKKEVIDIFNLAQTYYVQRKYLLCISQADKLHSIVAFYANSKELETLCKQALELEQIEQDRRRKEEAQVEAENRIRKIVDECRAKLRPTTTSAEMDLCLQAAIELNPQDGSIVDLQNTVKVQENAVQERKDKESARQARIRAGKAQFQTAVNSYKAGQLKVALKQFTDFLTGSYDLPEEKTEAQRSIASITKTLDDKLGEQLGLCQTAFEQGRLKDAITACDRVLKESPSNETAKSNKNQAFSQLKREMKSIYEDSSLEESMGNIELAKEKWQKILDTSLPEDDYYKKAKQKLKKYGIGM